MISKVLVLCAALAAANASAIWSAPIVNTGVSASSMKQDGLGNYAFGYDIVDGKGASNSRAEVGDAAGNKKGSYSLADIDGRARRVDYVADGHGFRAAVKTNEPGTAMSAPASAVIASPYAAPVAPVVSSPLAAVGHGSIIGVPVGLGGIIGAPLGQGGIIGASLGHGGIIGSPLGLGGIIGTPMGVLGGIGKSIVW